MGSEMAACMPICLSELPDSLVLRWFSDNSQGDVDSHTHISSDEPIGAEEEQEIFAGKFVITVSRREDLPLGQIQFGKFTDCVSPLELHKSFAEVPWLVREVPTPNQLAW